MTMSSHVMVTCYDATFAKILAEAQCIDSILVGDSLGMVIQGHHSTTTVTMNEMLYHTAAVARGLKNASCEKKPKLIGDMPIHSYDTPEMALRNARALIEAGAEMVKVEGPVVSVVEKLRENQIPVCGHIGLTPQSILDFKLQGKTEAEALRLRNEAKVLDAAGVELLVLEMIPSGLAKEISLSILAPTVGIGAGAHCGGQVLVLYDLLGLNRDFNPKFLKKFIQGYSMVSDALRQYAHEVRQGVYPTEQHSFKSPSLPSSEIVVSQ